MFETEHLHNETDDRFDRLRRIAWWDQKKLQEAKGICKIKLSQLPWYPPDNHRLEVPTWN